MEHSFFYKKRLRELSLFSLEKRQLRGDPISVRPCLKTDFRGRTRLCWVSPSARTRAKRQKMIHREFHLNMRKNFFTVRVIIHWNIAQRGCGVFLTGDIPETSGCNPVKRALRQSRLAGRWGQMTHCAPFQPDPFWDSPRPRPCPQGPAPFGLPPDSPQILSGSARLPSGFPLVFPGPLQLPPVLPGSPRISPSSPPVFPCPHRAVATHRPPPRFE